MSKSEKVYRFVIITLVISPLINLCLINIFPIFLTFPISYMDGGSTEFYGIGYKIIKCHTIAGDNSIYFGFYNLDISICGENTRVRIEINKHIGDETSYQFDKIMEITDIDKINQIRNIKNNAEKQLKTDDHGYPPFWFRYYQKDGNQEMFNLYLYKDSINAGIVYDDDINYYYIASEEDTKALKQLLLNN